MRKGMRCTIRYIFETDLLPTTSWSKALRLQLMPGWKSVQLSFSRVLRMARWTVSWETTWSMDDNYEK